MVRRLQAAMGAASNSTLGLPSLAPQAGKDVTDKVSPKAMSSQASNAICSKLETPPWVLIAAIVIFNVIGKIGDAVGPAMVGTKPMSLLLLNSSNTHCILTTTSVAFMPWILITLGRRFIEDPLYYYMGWRYRTAALDLLSSWCPDASENFDKAETMFKTNLYAAVVLNPGATVCALAGASRMPPLYFFSLNVGSTAAQLLLMRGVCSIFPDKVDYALELIQAYMKVLLAIMLGITLFGALPLLRSKKNVKGAVGKTTKTARKMRKRTR